MPDWFLEEKPVRRIFIDARFNANAICLEMLAKGCPDFNQSKVGLPKMVRPGMRQC